MSSIRRQLVCSISGVLLLAGVLTAALTYSSARMEVREIFDYRLRTAALSVRGPGLGRSSTWDQASVDPAGEITLQVWGPEGDLVFHSTRSSPLPRVDQEGFRTISLPGGDWRVYTHVTSNRTVQAGQSLHARRLLVAQAALRILLPLLVILPITGILAWVLIGRGLRPLRQVSTALTARQPDSLDALPHDSLPAELRPLIDALNQLLARLREVLEGQRVFITDVAHELRTPFAALVLQAELAQGAQSDAERGSAFERLRSGILRVTRLVDQLLTLARLEPEGGNQSFTEIDLAALARQGVIDLLPLARQGGIDLGIARMRPAAIRGDVHALGTLVRNLIDNAVRYTPRGGRVDVEVSNEGDMAVFEVIDTGPGIPPLQRSRVFERFYRCDGNGADGTGLGLAIVRRVADRHRAQIDLLDGPDGEGLRVRVRFPLLEAQGASISVERARHAQAEQRAT